MEGTRILLVDDHQIVREGLRRMLELEPGIVVAEAADADEALAQLEAFSPDVILMDIKMPKISGIELTSRLKGKKPDCNIIVLTLYDEYLSEAIRAGAVGYLSKDVKREELMRAIRAVQEGKSALALSLNRDLLIDFAAPAKDKMGQKELSERELAILRLIAKGVTTGDVASQLYLSEATIKRSVHRIFDKLGVRNRSEAVAEAYKRKLI